MNPPIEIRPPNISAWAKGNTGLPYVWSFDSNLPGPHCAIVALTHGNEFCGAIAIDELLRAGMRPARGRLSFVFANVEAFARFDAHAPFASRCVEEDFNRLWDERTLESTRTSVDLRRARALRAFFDSVDHLLDLHSMHEACAPLLLCGASKKGLVQARQMGVPTHVMVDAGHSAGKRLMDYADFSDDASEKTAFLVECGQHWAASSVVVARDSCARFLAFFKLTNSPPVAHTSPQTVIEIAHVFTVRDEKTFRWARTWQGLEVVEHAGTVLGVDGGDDLKTPFDHAVMIMPTREAKTGHTAVRLGRIVP